MRLLVVRMFLVLFLSGFSVAAFAGKPGRGIFTPLVDPFLTLQKNVEVATAATSIIDTGAPLLGFQERKEPLGGVEVVVSYVIPYGTANPDRTRLNAETVMAAVAQGVKNSAGVSYQDLRVNGFYPLPGAYNDSELRLVFQMVFPAQTVTATDWTKILPDDLRSKAEDVFVDARFQPMIGWTP